MRLDVAIVGAGAAGMYAVHHLLEQSEIEVRIDLFERLPTPWGLIRAGVAPDHPEKKQIADRLFQFYLKRPNVRFFGNVAIGSNVAHEELAAFYDAVIYAVGAEDDRPLGIPGEDLSGSVSARQFVAWYNGHPDYRRLAFDLAIPRAVIVGTGNVALDVARILTLPERELARTDIADHALEALRTSCIEEVVILGRRGPRHAAFHNPELEELLHLEDVEVRVDTDEASDLDDAACDWDTRRKLATLKRLQARRISSPRKRIVFRFGRAPVGVVGADRVAGVEVRGSAPERSEIACGLLLKAIGYRGRAFPRLPFDHVAGVISNVEGRVADETGPRFGTYVTGWIKRGPRGVIGSNKRCAGETVDRLLDDARAGRLTTPKAGDIASLLAARGHRVVTYHGWRTIDAAERRAGHPQGRPRIKQADIGQLLATAGLTR